MPTAMYLWHAAIMMHSHAGLAGSSSRGVGSGTQGRYAHGSQTHIDARCGRWAARGGSAAAVIPQWLPADMHCLLQMLDCGRLPAGCRVSYRPGWYLRHARLMPARARAGAAHFTALLQSVFLLGCVSPRRQRTLSTVDVSHMARLTGLLHYPAAIRVGTYG